MTRLLVWIDDWLHLRSGAFWDAINVLFGARLCAWLYRENSPVWKWEERDV